MPHRGVFGDDEDEGFEPEEDEGEFDSGDDEDEEPTVPCPYCRRPIHEEAPRCPYCENYLSAEDAPPGPKRWWVIVGVLVCLFLVYLWIAW